MKQPGSKPGLKRLAIVLGIVAIAAMSSTVYLIHYYGESRPTAAQEQAGRIHVITVHSRTVYLTNNEYALVFMSHGITVVVIGVFVGTVLRARFANK